MMRLNPMKVTLVDPILLPHAATKHEQTVSVSLTAPVSTVLRRARYRWHRFGVIGFSVGPSECRTSSGGPPAGE